MRSAGIDLAKTGYGAIALAVDGEPAAAYAWKNVIKNASTPEALDAYYKWLRFKLNTLHADVIAVEHVMGLPNRKVAQILSQFEGVALLAAKQSGAIVINPGAGQARSAALRIAGNSKKEVAWETIRKMYPEFDFGRANAGGTDKGDAMTHALAAPILLERK